VCGCVIQREESVRTSTISTSMALLGPDERKCTPPPHCCLTVVVADGQLAMSTLMRSSDLRNFSPIKHMDAWQVSNGNLISSVIRGQRIDPIENS
jgi:hypothetical protein